MENVCHSAMNQVIMLTYKWSSLATGAHTLGTVEVRGLTAGTAERWAGGSPRIQPSLCSRLPLRLPPALSTPHQGGGCRTAAPLGACLMS